MSQAFNGLPTGTHAIPAGPMFGPILRDDVPNVSRKESSCQVRFLAKGPVGPALSHEVNTAREKAKRRSPPGDRREVRSLTGSTEEPTTAANGAKKRILKGFHSAMLGEAPPPSACCNASLSKGCFEGVDRSFSAARAQPYLLYLFNREVAEANHLSRKVGRPKETV